jgi:uncharacterized membrane protein
MDCVKATCPVDIFARRLSFLVMVSLSLSLVLLLYYLALCVFSCVLLVVIDSLAQ